MTTETTTIHKFELAGLGKAPFRFVGIEQKSYQACHGAPIQPGGACDYCATGIYIQCQILSADGKRFKVGSDCVAKVGDAGLKRIVAREVSKLTKAKEAARITAAADSLSDPELREKLEALPHPRAFAGQTLMDWVNWMLANGGHTGKLKAARAIEKVQK